MRHYILWFQMISIAVLFASTISSFILYSKYKHPWLKWYFFMIVSALFSVILFQYEHFQVHYLANINEQPDPDFFTVTQVLVARVYSVAVPFFCLALLEIKAGKKRFLIWANAFLYSIILILFIAVFEFLGKDHHLTAVSYILLLIADFVDLIVIFGFAVYAVVKWKNIANKKSKRGMLLFLILIVFSLPIVILDEVLTEADIAPVLQAVVNMIFPVYYFVIYSIMLVHNVLDFYQPSVAEETRSSLDGLILQHGITQRETEIIRQIMTGKKNQEIGDLLHISVNTVNNHIYNIYKKCEVKSRVELINKIIPMVF